MDPHYLTSAVHLQSSNAVFINLDNIKIYPYNDFFVITGIKFKQLGIYHLSQAANLRNDIFSPVLICRQNKKETRPLKHSSSLRNWCSEAKARINPFSICLYCAVLNVIKLFLVGNLNVEFGSKITNAFYFVRNLFLLIIFAFVHVKISS